MRQQKARQEGPGTGSAELPGDSILPESGWVVCKKTPIPTTLEHKLNIHQFQAQKKPPEGDSFLGVKSFTFNALGYGVP